MSTIPAIADKPFALIDARIKECTDKMIRGACGGNTPEEVYIAYRVQVDLYKELVRLRGALELAFTEDEEEEPE